MFEYHSIHSMATERVAMLAGETATRRAIESAHRGARARERRSSNRFVALRFPTR